MSMSACPLLCPRRNFVSIKDNSETHMNQLLDTRGFTLIEMMIVGAILGITATIAVPSISQWMARYQMKQATTELAGNLNLARAASMSRGAGITVTTSMTNGRATVAFGGIFPPVTLNQSISNITAATVGFNTFGLRAGGGATNTLIALSQTQGTTYSVMVTPAGKVDWCATATCP